MVPTVADLFFGFLKVTVTGFGGILPWARREFVSVRRWMSQDEFNELFSLCQFLPGPNIVNFALVYGYRLHGVAGAAAGTTGLLGPPVILMIFAGMLYKRYGELPAFHGGLIGLAAAAAGLLISSSRSNGGAVVPAAAVSGYRACDCDVPCRRRFSVAAVVGAGRAGADFNRGRVEDRDMNNARSGTLTTLALHFTLHVVPGCRGCGHWLAGNASSGGGSLALDDVPAIHRTGGDCAGCAGTQCACS